MRRATRSRTVPKRVILAFSVLLLPLACSPKSPEEQVAAARLSYEVELGPLAVDRFGGGEGMMDTAEDAMGEDTMGEDAVGDEGMAEDPMGETVEGMAEDGMDGGMGTVLADVTLDIRVNHTGAQSLPGITLDVTQVDSDENEKGHWYVWIDTSDLGRGTYKQTTHTLEAIEYAEGDGFNAEVRANVPAEERSNYKEFSTTGEP